jgi:hypothetical protein
MAEKLIIAIQDDPPVKYCTVTRRLKIGGDWYEPASIIALREKIGDGNTYRFTDAGIEGALAIERVE